MHPLNLKTSTARLEPARGTERTGMRRPYLARIAPLGYNAILYEQ